MTARPGTRWLAGAAVVAAVLVPAPAAAQQASAQERAAAVARPAVVVVEVRWHGWVRDPRTGEVFGGAGGYQVAGSCTGFAVHADGYVVTAGHCVDPGPEGAGEALVGLAARDLQAVGRVRDVDRAAVELAEHAEVEGAADGSPVRREVFVRRGVDYDGQILADVLPAEVVDVVPGSEGDVALLRIERGRLPVLAIGDGGDDLPTGTPILAIGYPGSADQISDPTLEPSVKDGVVSNRRTVDGVPFYEVSAVATGGMSGGPVIDHTGAVIGLVSHGPGGEASGFTFLAAASSIVDLLAGNDIDHGLGPIDRNFRAGLAHYFAGRPAEALTFFDAVLDASPTHQQAAEFRRLAEQAGPGPAGRVDPLVWWAIAAGAVAVVAAVAAGVLLLLRLSAPASPPAAALPGPLPGPADPR